MSMLWNALILANIYAILCLGGNLMVGYSGLLNLALAGMYLVGSYTVAFLTARLGWPFLPALAAAMAVSAVFSLTLGLSSIKYKKTSFALVSLAVQVLLITIVKNLTVFGGVLGIQNIPSPVVAGFQFNTPGSFWGLSLAFLIISIVFSAIIQRMPWALALKAVRDDETAALALGKNAGRFRLQVFLVSSLFFALAGALYAAHMQYVDVSSFSVDESIFIVMVLIIGGTGTTRGPVLGAFCAIFLTEWLRFLAVPMVYAAGIRNIVFGLAVIILMLYRPRGIYGKYSYD